jgi:hypothetical protein
MFIPLMLIAAAQADSLQVDSAYVTGVSDAVEYQVGGNWTRVVKVEDDLYLFHAAGGDYWKILLDENLQLNNDDRTPLTGRTDLDDHMLEPCPDGGFLHLASGGINQDSDFAYSFRYDANFNKLASGVLGEADPDIRFNDMAALCHEKGIFGAFLVYDDWKTMIYILDNDGKKKERLTVSELPIAEGASFMEDPLTGELALLTAAPAKNGLYINWMNWNLIYQGNRRILDIPPEEGQAFWPQGHLRLQDRTLIAYVMQPTDEGYIGEFGNIWMAVFDLEWNLLENLQITHDDGPGGTMRPSLTLIDDVLYMGFDEIENFPPGDIQPRLLTMTLDLEAFDAPLDPTTPGDTAPCPDDTAEDTGKEAPMKPTCGCSQGPTAPTGWPIVFGLLAFGRRRKRL